MFWEIVQWFAGRFADFVGLLVDLSNTIQFWVEDKRKQANMLKKDELTNPKSCLNKANDDELVFVLLGRDPAAPDTIRDWARRRITLGKNKVSDEQIMEALSLAVKMEIK
jgi:hypothetical protein